MNNNKRRARILCALLILPVSGAGLAQERYAQAIGEPPPAPAPKAPPPKPTPSAAPPPPAEAPPSEVAAAEEPRTTRGKVLIGIGIAALLAALAGGGGGGGGSTTQH